MLQARGLAFRAAVAFGAVIGPSQVAVRTIEMFVARFHRPIWTKLASTSFVALGIVLISAGLPFPPRSFSTALGSAPSTLPLAVFSAADYAAIMGRIAPPSLVAQAVAPTIAAVLIDAAGFDGCWRYWG